jgi:hypothetical protein
MKGIYEIKYVTSAYVKRGIFSTKKKKEIVSKYEKN